MRRYGLFYFVVLFLVLAGPWRAAEATDLYDTGTLQKANELYSKNIRLVWTEDLLARLTPSEREAAGNVRLNIPLMGIGKSPFDYYSSPRTREVTIPILSVKFFDDLAVASAWFSRHGCTEYPVSDYVGILRYQGLSLPPGTRFPPPLRALTIPQNALGDPFVDDVSQKTLKSAIYFMMVHELGHVIYQHRPYYSISRPEAQAQEAQADEFALNIMRRISVLPIGMVLLLKVSSRVEPAPSDFPNPQDYEKFVRQTSTHPRTSRRLLAISEAIRSNADEFSRGQEDPARWKPRILQAANEIGAVGSALEDPKSRDLQKYRGETMRIGELGNTCRPK